MISSPEPPSITSLPSPPNRTRSRLDPLASMMSSPSSVFSTKKPSTPSIRVTVTSSLPAPVLSTVTVRYPLRAMVPSTTRVSSPEPRLMTRFSRFV